MANPRLHRKHVHISDSLCRTIMSPSFHSCPHSDFFCNRCGEDVAYSSLYLVQSAVSVPAVPFASTLACLKKQKHSSLCPLL